MNTAFAIPGNTLRYVAAVTVLALLAWATGLPAFINHAKAANVSTFSDTLSDSDLGVDATHTIQFELVDDFNASETLTVTFDPVDGDYDFDLTSVALGDIAVSAVSGGTINQVPAVGSCTGDPSQLYASDVNTVTDYIELTVCSSDTITSGTVMEIVVGSTNFINNPSTAGSYVIRLGGTNSNEGDARVAIIDDVTVTAQVNTQFTFSINPVDAGVAVNDDVTVTSGTTTATSVPFGVLAPNVPKLLAQELRVDTNAFNGFAVTVEADQTLTAGNGATIDTFTDGTDVASSTQWTGPAGTMGSPDTYGHWGLTSDDDVVSSTTPNLWGSSEALYVGDFVNNPVEVFYHNTPVQNDAGMGVGSTTVAYKVEVMELQEAAKDYTATLTYIATPVF